MGLLSRTSTIIKAKISRFLDRFEDPRETLDYSYNKQVELLNKVRRNIASVVTAKKRLEMQLEKLRGNVERLDEQAREAVKLGREDLAKIALQRKYRTLSEISLLEKQIDSLAKEQERLEAAEKRLAAKIESFRAYKEVIKAQYTAAEAQVKITEAVTGISEEMEDVGMTIRRAEDKTEEMKARALALEELVEKGTLTDVLMAGKDEITRELEKITEEAKVEEELEAIKREVSG